MDTIIDRAVAALESLKVTTRDPSLSFADMRRACRVAEVRAVLEAIREPTEAMVVAAGPQYKTVEGAGMIPTLGGDARSIWPKMIDVALGK